MQIGHYQLGNELGAGGMGTVYRGTDERTGDIVAIKQLKSEIATPETIERFRREGEALRDLNHPNIVKMLDMFEYEGQHYLVMEYVSGGELSDLIKTSDIPLETVLTLAIDLADALTRAHKLNIIHRDLKPENVLIGDDGVLRLTDFGIARIGSQGRVTETGLVLGTLPYMPPEAFDDVSIDTCYDVWAFGVILFELLAGQRPFDDNGLIANILSAPLPDLEALCPDAPIALVDLVYRMLERNIDARIPSVRIVGTELEAIQQGRSQKPQPTQRFDVDIPEFMTLSKHNLPAQMTPFVGREHELDELEKLLKDSTMRLITILAQGGMGKTRLSLELAQRAVDASLYADGVYFVELAPLTAAENIPNAIGDACGFQFLGEGTPREQLLSILKDRQTLLVIDNYEHLPDGFALVTDILQSAPSVEIVATSRQQLSQAGETLFYLSGMDFPDFDTLEDALEYAAIKLFMNSAKRANPSFELTENNLDYVARICKLVQGMPLGIVLAASWLTLLDVAEVAGEIQDSLDFLETDETNLPERQRSIRAVMDYSWGQMTEAEQNVFMKLSVFRGGFTRDAAQAVAGASLRILMSLTKKSFIRRNADSGRYEIHELLRQYAGESLMQSGNLDDTKLAHMHYFARFMAERAVDIKGRRQFDGLNEIEVDWENTVDAWYRAIQLVNYDALDLMIEGLLFYTEMHSQFRLGYELFQFAVRVLITDQTDDLNPILNRLRVHWLNTLNISDSHQISKLSYDYLMLSLNNARNLGERDAEAWCLFIQGSFSRYLDYPDKSPFTCFEAARTIFYDTNNLYGLARVLRRLSEQCLATNKDHLFRSLNQEYLELTRKIGDHTGMAHGILYAAVYAARNGDSVKEKDLLEEAYDIWYRLGDRKSVAYILQIRAFRNLFAGQLENAKHLAIQNKTILEEVNYTGISVDLMIFGFIAVIKGDYQLGKELANLLRLSTFWWTYNNPRERIYCVAALGLGDFEEAHKILVGFYQYLASHYELVEAIYWLPIISCLLAHNDEKEYSVELYGLAMLQSTDLVGWMEHWELLQDIQKSLKAQLGEEAYNAAWERGKSLDLETVFQELIEEF
jgi:serine/threonine protein kinase